MELIEVDTLEDAVDHAVETELMFVDKLVDALDQAVESELIPVDMELTFVDSESDVELTTVESEFDIENNWLPFTASVLLALMAPAVRLVMECEVISRYCSIWMLVLAPIFT